MPESLDELGFSALDVVDLLVELIKQTDADSMDDLKIIEIIGGTDKDGKPDISVTNGAHRVVYNYDGNLFMTGTRFYDSDGNNIKSY